MQKKKKQKKNNNNKTTKTRIIDKKQQQQQKKQKKKNTYNRSPPGKQLYFRNEILLYSHFSGGKYYYGKGCHFFRRVCVGGWGREQLLGRISGFGGGKLLSER